MSTEQKKSDEELDKLSDQAFEELLKIPIFSTSESEAVRLQSRIIAVSNEKNTRLQRKVVALEVEVGEQTKEAIRWSRRLVYATGILATATFVLAIVTYLK